MKKILITRKQLGDKYPFNVSPVFIEKDRIGGLYVVHEKVKYNLNGVAKKGVDIETIWLDHPELHCKKSLNIIFKICKEKGLM